MVSKKNVAKGLALLKDRLSVAGVGVVLVTLGWGRWSSITNPVGLGNVVSDVRSVEDGHNIAVGLGGLSSEGSWRRRSS